MACLEQILLLTSLLVVTLAYPGRIKLPKSDPSKSRIRSRIAGGHDADIKDYPYQVALEHHDTSQYCGGSIISKSFILTAGHCLEGLIADEIYIRVNSSFQSEGGLVVKAKNIYNNPNFVNNYLPPLYDMALLELAEPLNLGQGIQAIPLVEANTVLKEGTKVTISGWGASIEGDRFGSKPLQVVETLIVPNDKCRKYYGDDVTDSMICAGEPDVGGKGSCGGDSGGPLAVSGTLAGVVSWGGLCGDIDSPGVYAKVANEFLRGWVKNVTGI